MAINLSQFITGTIANASSVNLLFSSAVSSGNLIVLHGAQFNSGSAGKFSAVIDNVNANNYTIGVQSTMVSDTAVTAIIAYKAGISSGGAASTYRVSVNMTAAANGISVCALEYSGGPWAVGSTKSASGTSSSPSPGATTASSTPVLFVANATNNSTATFNSTINTGAWRATVDPTNANCILAVGDSTNSSLTQSPTFGLNTSTRWMGNSIVFMGAGSGGAAAAVIPQWFTMLGMT